MQKYSEPKAPKQDFSQSLGRVDDDEQVLAVIKRHPFGIVKLYAQILLGLGAAAGLIYFLLPDLMGETDAPIYPLVMGAALIVVAVMVVIALIATIIYYQSSLVITDKTITQTIQTSLFSRKISQLAISSIEDVTANKNGFFPTLFNYGRLLVETAGEQENFHFDYAPHADHYAKLILEARQKFMGHRETEFFEAKEGYGKIGHNQAQTQSEPAVSQATVPASNSSYTAPTQSYDDFNAPQSTASINLPPAQTVAQPQANSSAYADLGTAALSNDPSAYQAPQSDYNVAPSASYNLPDQSDH